MLARDEADDAINESAEAELIDLKQVRHVFEEQIPFNKLLGIEHHVIERGRIQARVKFRPELIGDPARPALHGGVLASIADAVSGASVYTLLNTQDRCSTVDLRIDYLRPGLVEQDIQCEAEVLRLGNQVAVASARLFQDSGENIAVSKAVFMVRRG